MSIQQNASKAESNLYSRRSLKASLKLLKVLPAPFLPKFCKFTLLLLVPLAFSYQTATPARAATLWYNGDPDGQSSQPNQVFWTGARLGNRFILEDFTVPSTDVGWHIDTVWSNNLIDPISTFSQIAWQILTVRPLENSPIFTYDRIIASGLSPATITPTTFQVSDRPVFRVSASGLDVRLDSGTYWLAVAPFYEREDSYPSSFPNRPASEIVTTRGSNAVGTPPGNNGNSYRSPYAPTFYPDTADYSMGIEGSAVPEPSSMFSLLGFGALTLGFRWRRKQQLSLDANKRAIDSD